MVRIFRKITGSQDSGRPQAAPENDAPKRWRADLETARLSLEEIIASSEHAFISIGERLMDFALRSSGMNETSRSVVRLMTGEGFSGVTQGLSTLLEDLRALMSDSEGRLGRITGVLNEYLTILAAAEKSLDTFGGLVLNLNMLGFLTRVENAHLESANTGFASLTDDVRRLAELIKSKSQDIRSTAQPLKQAIEGALKGVQTFEKTRGAQAGALLEETVTHHRTLSGRYTAAVQAAERVADMVGGIAQSTGRIVESLQFHDISRQQIEHVVHVIDSLSGHIDSPRCTLRESAAVLEKVCSLQASQLGQTRSEIMDALELVKDSLTHIGLGVGEIVNATSATVLTADSAGVAFMDRVLQGIEAVMQGLEATTAEESALLETVSATSAQVSRMSGFVREIEELGIHLQLIALNARIKAAHLGTQGAALDTISGSIYALSHEARQDTVKLSDMLSHVVRTSEGAQNDLNLAQEHKQGAVRTLMATMAGLKDCLTQVNAEVQGQVAELRREGQALQDDIQTCAAGITVHTDMSAVLEKVLSLLEGLHAQSVAMADGEEEDANAVEFLAELDQIYTMQSERRIHQMHVEPCGIDRGDQGACATELGGNVELF
ncbi:MAG TPA: hypothetical protein PLB81_00145 [Deltaproteobacteria bacterium]|nr:hypothetical protein [Deltaproteobacteria bacterium]